jgi:glycerophosphoryl diester phosphodiesterase
MKTDALVIAHRGASGYLPEHTREAKMLAYGHGADFLEQDVVATRDGQLVVLHDIHLDDVTDVAARFAGRRRSDGRHYVIDFDLAELRELNVVERRRPGGPQRLRADRFGDDGVSFRIVTLEEEIRLIRELNRTTGRDVGVYPEIKHPDWHRRHGFDLSAALLNALETWGYVGPEAGAFVQCFDDAELRRCREELGTRLKLVQLVERRDLELTPPMELRRIAEYADVVAPHYSQALVADDDGGLQPAPLVAEAEASGLEMHVYTLRREDAPSGATFERLLEFLFAEARVEGIFCDQPDAAVRVREGLGAKPFGLAEKPSNSR